MFVSLDLETTGFSKENDQIIEFGAIKFDLEGNSETLSFLVKPHKEIPEIVTYITRITNEDVETGFELEDKKQEILDFIEDLPIIGHNIQFDTGFLKAKGFEINNPEYDTQVLSGILLPKMPSYSLEVISEELGLTHEEKHRALDDAIAAQELFLYQCRAFLTLSKDTQKQYLDIASKSDWPGKELFKKLYQLPQSTQTPYNNKKPQTTEQPETNAHKILQAKDKQAFEEIPPFKHLIIDISNNAPENHYISVPEKDFNKTENLVAKHIATIDKHSKYLSPTRFQNLLTKNNFQIPEATTILKCLNWLNYTTTGLTEEIPLYGDERQYLSQINVDPSTENPLETKFIKQALKKDQTSSALCTHRYTNKTLFTENDHLIIFNLQKFCHSLRKNISVYQKQSSTQRILEELQQNSQHSTIQELQTDLELLYNNLQAIFGEPAEENQFLKRINITPLTYDHPKWQKCQFHVKNLINKSKQLTDIKKPENLQLLSTWKKHLQQLLRFLQREHSEKTLSWIEQRYDQELILRSIPTDMDNLIQQKFQEFKSVKIIDEGLHLSPNLPSDFQIQNFSTKSDNIHIKLITDIDNKNAEQIANLSTSLPGKTAIVCSSKRAVQHITLELFNQGHEVLSQLTGSRSKLLQKFQKDTKNTPLILTANTWIDFNLHDQIDNIIIDKVPFDPPNSPEIEAQSKGKLNPFIEVQLPRAISKLKKILNRLRGQRKTTAYILDPRISKSQYGDKILQELETVGEVVD